MSVKRMFQLESDTVTEQSVEIPFEFTKKNSIPEGKELGNSIVVTPITVRTWFRIKPLLLSIDKEDRDKIVANKNDSFTSDISELMSKYDEVLFNIVCLGIHNKKGNMPEWFRNVLQDNCTWEDIYILLNAILFRIAYNPFLNSIIALKAVSPLSEAEIIALQNNKKSWENRKIQS